MPGPRLPATNRGWSGVEKASDGPPRDLAAATLSSRVRSAMPVLREHDAEGAECVGLDHVDARLEERAVYPFDDVGTGDDEDLVATLESPASEIVRGQVRKLERGAHRAVEDDDPFAGRLEVSPPALVEGHRFYEDRGARCHGGVGLRHVLSRLPAGTIRPDAQISTPKISTPRISTPRI